MIAPQLHGKDQGMNEHQRTSAAGSVSTNGNTGEAAHLAREAKAKAHAAVDETSSAVRDMQRRAGKEAEGVVQQVEAVAEQQKDSLSAMLSDIAAAVETAGQQLQSRQQDGAAGFATSIGQGLSRLSETLRRQRPGEILGDVQQLARANPTAFIGGAVLVGVALARFAKASAPRGAAASHTSTSRSSRLGE